MKFSAFGSCARNLVDNFQQHAQVKIYDAAVLPASAKYAGQCNCGYELRATDKTVVEMLTNPNKAQWYVC